MNNPDVTPSVFASSRGLNPRDPRLIDEGTSALLYPDLRRPRGQLDALRIEHLDVASRMLKKGDLWTTDLVLMAMLQRSYGLVDGIIDAVDRFNIYIAAASLRMQIDNLVRAHYLAFCDDAAAVSAELISGQEFQKLKDREGKSLRDSRLIELAEAEHGWVKDVYKATSGYIHYSARHIQAGIKETGQDGGFLMTLPAGKETVHPDMWHQILEGTRRATAELFEYFDGWSARKGLPPGQQREL